MGSTNALNPKIKLAEDMWESSFLAAKIIERIHRRFISIRDLKNATDITTKNKDLIVNLTRSMSEINNSLKALELQAKGLDYDIK